MQQRVFTIAENAPVARDTYRLQLTGDTAAITAPGQFVDIRLAGRFLRRPVSVCSWSDGALTLYYKVAGAGTAQLSTLTPGTELDLLVGLGNGFDTAPAGVRPLLVGGGVGASPLYGLAQQLVAEGRSPLAVLGFRTAAEMLLADAFCALGIPVTVVTEDGTMGARGFVTEALPEGCTYVYACGPMPMLQGLRLRRVHGLHLRNDARQQARLQGRARVHKGGDRMAATAVTLCGIELENPIIPASGTFGYGQEFAQLYDINMLGTFSFKGTTRAPRFGNPTPRIAEYAGGMLNAVGLQNPGVDAVIAHELPELKKVFHKPVMANVSGFSVEEYAEVCAGLDAQPQVGWLEVNISCPNVHGGGAAFGAEPSAAAEVTRAVRAVTKKPIILKLSPTAADIAAVAKACEDAGADGVSLINTLPGMRIDLARRRPLLANRTGGMSGPGMFPLAVRMVYQVYEAVRIPIVGMGGVTSAQDVLELMLAGATAVGVGAANLVEPYACKHIIETLPDAMARFGIDDLRDIIGGAHHG